MVTGVPSHSRQRAAAVAAQGRMVSVVMQTFRGHPWVHGMVPGNLTDDICAPTPCQFLFLQAAPTLGMFLRQAPAPRVWQGILAQVFGHPVALSCLHVVIHVCPLVLLKTHVLEYPESRAVPFSRNKKAS